jgi:hypothetical protein
MLLPFFGRRLRRRALAPGRYLTDGRSLLIVIEECVTLESYACAAIELKAMGFRPVRRATPPPGAEPRPETPSAPLHAV